MQNKATQTSGATHYPDEHILVVPRAKLFVTGEWQGLATSEELDIAAFVNTITQQQEFQPRAAMEHDPAYKQIIPYIIFKFKNKFFLMQRTSTASEARLRDKYSFGIGGHVRKEDIVGGSIESWAQREFDEEVAYRGTLTFTTLGVLNDDSNDVGKVHLGLVLLAEGDSDDIAVRSELKSGALYTIAQCASFEEKLEGWSAIVFKRLQKMFA